jgi:DNA ligase D
MPKGTATELDIDGQTVRITSPDKVFFGGAAGKAPSHTKLDLVNFYLSIGDPLMRAMRGRPVLLQRFPDGVGGNNFFQKRVPDSAPEWLETTIVSTPNGTTSKALVIADLAHVAWAVNLGCLGFHVWPSKAADPGVVDELRIDLDPTPTNTFDMIRETAYELKALFDEVGIRGYPKTTGSKGMHVYVGLIPEWDSIMVRAAAVAVARELARRRPDLITDAWWKEERGERVFIDFNQNAPHKTVFGAWSVRSRVIAPVSTPVTWDEVATVNPDSLTLATVPERVASMGDPWQEMRERPQSLEPLLDLVAADQEAGLPDAPWPPVYPKMPGEPPRVAPSRARKEPPPEIA